MFASSALSIVLATSVLFANAEAEWEDSAAQLLYDAKQGMYLAPRESLCGVMSLCAVLREFHMPYDVGKISEVSGVGVTGCNMELLNTAGQLGPPLGKRSFGLVVCSYLSRNLLISTSGVETPARSN